MNTEDHIESRFAHLIRPIRDLAANWDVDIAAELDDYLAELELIHVEDDDIMNFSEAALLIEGSASIYSKKVEYLYALIFNKLDKIITKSKSKQNDSSEAELEDFDNDNDRTLNPLDEFVSLTLDNDINIKHSHSSTQQTTKKTLRPLQSSLFVGFDSSGKKDGVSSSESNFLSICNVQDNGILLLKQDIEPKFNFKDIEDPFVLNSSICNNDLENHETISHGKEDVSMDIENENISLDREEVDTYEYENEGNFESTTYHSPFQDKKRSDDHLESNNRTFSVVIDPWEEHDPHDPGKKEPKPFKKGKTAKVIKSDIELFDIKKSFKSILDVNTVTLSLMRPFLSEFDYIYHIKTKNISKKIKKNIKKEIHDIEKNEGLIASENEYDIPLYDNIDILDNIEDDISRDDSNEVQFSYEGTDMDIIDLGLDDKQYTYEELCKIHIEKHFIDSQKYILETDLTKRVAEWNEKINPILEEQDKRKMFDIKSYGEELKESIPEERKEEVINFDEIVKEKEPFEVCRYFTAMLQLVNSGEIELRAEKKNETHEISIRLLV